MRQMYGGDLMLEISDQEALEKFLMDIDILDTIYARLSHFNPFETLSIVNAEIRHSNVLAWLLNPNENHGLGDIFLKKIIQDVYYKNKEYIESKRLSLFDISLMDYHDFIIKREWNNIDIICVSDDMKFVFVIENKVWSKESENQLMKYFHTVNREYPDYDKIFIFLTANNDTPSDADNWIPMDYGFIFETLQKVIGIKGDAISPNVKIFIEQYLYMLRRYIVGDNELEKICKDIYYKHQKALDLIFQYKPDIYTEIASALEKIVDSNPKVIKDTVGSKMYLRFITKAIDELIEKKGEGWVSSHRILLYEFATKNDKIVLKLYIGPGDEAIRRKIFRIAQNDSNKLKAISKELNPKWNQIYAKEILPKNYLEKYDSNIEDIRKELKNKIFGFFEHDMLEIDEIISNGYKEE